jgi:hypothetical protein
MRAVRLKGMARLATGRARMSDPIVVLRAGGLVRCRMAVARSALAPRRRQLGSRERCRRGVGRRKRGGSLGAQMADLRSAQTCRQRCVFWRIPALARAWTPSCARREARCSPIPRRAPTAAVKALDEPPCIPAVSFSPSAPRGGFALRIRSVFAPRCISAGNPATPGQLAWRLAGWLRQQSVRCTPAGAGRAVGAPVQGHH